MTLSEEQLRALAKMISLTRSSEVTCEQCQAKMAEFAEQTLAGQPLGDGLRDIEEHLALCGECEEEFKALVEVLKGE